MGLDRNRIDFEAGDYMVRAGDRATALYIIESGRVAIVLPRGPGVLLAELGPGDLFGEAALNEHAIHVADAIARTQVHCLELTGEELPALLHAQPDLAAAIARKLAERFVISERRRAELEVAALRRGTGTTPAVREVARPTRLTPAGGISTVRSARHYEASAAQDRHDGSAPVSMQLRFLLRHVTGDIRVPEGRPDYLVGRFDPSSGVIPEIDLGELDVARSLSRRHAHIIETPTGMRLREEPGAMNGTFLNGRRVPCDAMVDLKSGDRLRFGAVEVEYVENGASG